MLIPGAEPPGPAARHVHPPHHGVLTADVAQEVYGTINKHPPEVRVLPLKEQIDARLDAHLGTAPGQFRELIVGQAVEKADSAKLVGAHHTVAVLLMRSAFGRASPPAPRRGWRDGTDISHTS